MVDVIMPTIRRSNWYTHNEAILQTLLFLMISQKERKKGVKIIQTIKEKNKHDTLLEPFKIKLRKIPDINFNATSKC